MLEKQARSIKKTLEEVTGENVSVRLEVFFFRRPNEDRDKAAALKIAGALMEKFGSGVMDVEEHNESKWIKVWDATTSLIVYYADSVDDAQANQEGS
ncbi:MAG: hypothetical protein DDT35_00430 [Firmicutes bacterium]|nr:hypothetical protein [Bacillota bacterium]